MPSSSANRSAARAQVVVPPRPADALGFALRTAFGQHLGLPEDMCAALRRLDAVKMEAH